MYSGFDRDQLACIICCCKSIRSIYVRNYFLYNFACVSVYLLRMQILFHVDGNSSTTVDQKIIELTIKCCRDYE